MSIMMIYSILISKRGNKSWQNMDFFFFFDHTLILKYSKDDYVK